MKNFYFNLVEAVFRYGSKWRRYIIGYYLAYIIAQAILSFSPYAFGRAIDILQKFTASRLHELIFWLAIGVLVILLFWLFHGPARLVERNIALKIQQTFRSNLYEQLTRMPLIWHQNHHSGNIITRLNRASTALYQFAENQFIYIEAIIKFFVSTGFLLWLSLPIGLLSLLVSIIAITTVVLFDRKLIRLYSNYNEIDNHVGGILFDYISNMTTVLALRLGKLTHANLYRRMMAVWPFFRKGIILNETKWFVMMIFLWSMQAVFLIGYIVHQLNTTGIIMIGTVVMIFRYQWDFNDVFYNFCVHYSDLVRMNTDVKGMQPILDDIKSLAHLPEGSATAREWRTIQIKDLTFQHLRETNEELVFNHIGLTINRGEKIALIGTSGSGKSTLLNILSGFYTPSCVELTIDGTIFNSLEPLRAITTLVPQDPEIFENTIAFNITMDLQTKPDELEHVAKLAGFWPVVNILPLGFATDICEKGLNLSVGQKQRLALARGLFAARFSSLILLDEPTSSVDLLTEKEILANIINAFPESTLIVSLHRLHLLPKFDSIIMLSDGKIVASGKTSQLLKNPGPVYDLWNSYR